MITTTVVPNARVQMKLTEAQKEQAKTRPHVGIMGVSSEMKTNKDIKKLMEELNDSNEDLSDDDQSDSSSSLSR